MAQLVDPFIPVNRHRPPSGQYGQQYFRKKPDTESPKTSPPLISEIRRPVRPASTPRTTQVPVPTLTHHLNREIERPRVSRDETPPKREAAPQQIPKPQSKPVLHAKGSPISKLQIPLILVSAVGVGLFLQSQTAGEAIIAIYAVYAILKHVASRTTFTLALVALVAVALLSAVQANSTMANNFAVYAFLLLIVGTVSMGLELRRS